MDVMYGRCHRPDREIVDLVSGHKHPRNPLACDMERNDVRWNACGPDAKYFQPKGQKEQADE